MTQLNLVSRQQQEEQPENFCLLDRIDEPITEPEMIFPELWTAKTMGLFTGDGGVGKTHFTLQLFLSPLRKHFHFFQGNRNESTSGYKSLLDVIPLRSQHTEKPSIATVTHGDVNDLRRSTVQQRSIVEVRVFTEDNQTL
jgi:hypothetical protein